MDFLFVMIGLVILMAAGDALVRGAVALSLRAGIPAIVVGSTIVAFGTSAPELLVSVQAALADAPGIALGNVVGSNIANIWLVLGVPALIAPIGGVTRGATRNLLFMLVSTVVFTALILPGTIVWWGGLVLLALVALMVGDSVRHSLEARAADRAETALADLEDVDLHIAGWKIAALMVVGLVGLPVGADLLVDGARAIARDFGVSETLIGLTIVAVGTSLPELATSVMAAVRRETDVAIGNVVGSNIFNLTFIIGVTALLTPIQVPEEILRRDIWAMILAALVVASFILMNRSMGRLVGVAFLAIYAGYIGVAVST